MRTHAWIGRLAFVFAASACAACAGAAGSGLEGGAAGVVPRVTSPGRNSDGSAKILPPGAPDLPGRTLTLRYEDFGPPAMAHPLLGDPWWQWSGGGSFEQDDSFDIRVVVFREISRDEVAARFPTSEGVSDYRLVEHREALRYLDSEIGDLGRESDPGLVKLRRELEGTRAKIVAALEGSP